MKILKFTFRVSLASLILLSNIAAGQSKFIENSFPVKNTTHATAIPGGWVLPMNSGDCSRNWILKCDAGTGINKKFFEADSSNTPSFVINNILRLPSGSFICAGLADKDADVLTFLYPYIFKMDNSEKIIWQTVFLDSLHRSLGGAAFKRVVSSPDGSIYAINSDNFIGKTDSLGRIIWMKSMPGVSDIIWTSKGLTASYNKGLTLLDTGGNIIKIYYPVSGEKLTGLENGTNGKFYAMNANNIYRIDSTFQITDSFQFIGYGSSSVTPPIVNYADDSGYYFAHGNSLKAFDLKGNLKWTNYLPSDCKITGLSSNENQLAVTGSTATSAFIKTYDENGNTAPITRDIEITKLNPIKVSMHSNGIYSYAVSVQMNVTLQNKGNETIDSVYLFSAGPLSSPNYFCSDEYLQSFHHLNFAPGDSTTLNISFGRAWEAPPGNPYDLNVTMYATAPNGKLNLSETSNAAKYSQTVLGINEKLSESQSINIYPNPATNILHIDNSTVLNTSISVSDITGKEIRSITNPKNHFEMDISGLPAGIYFVKAWNENGMKVEKIVKD